MARRPLDYTVPGTKPVYAIVKFELNRAGDDDYEIERVGFVPAGVARLCRSAYRRGFVPSKRDYRLGCRPVAPAP